MASRLKQAWWALARGNYRQAVLDLLPAGAPFDRIVVTSHYRKRFGRRPDLASPGAFSERIVALMLSMDGRSEIRGQVTDKDLVKRFVAERLGHEAAPATLAVLESAAAVREFRYPERCAIKATHDSGSHVFRRAGEPIDIERIVSWFGRNYYFELREPSYRFLQPKVIVEELLGRDGEDLPDFKLFCFHGVPAFIQMDTTRFVDHRRSFYSPRWHELDLQVTYPACTTLVPRPADLDTMLDYAAKLSKGFSFLRVDLYSVDGRLLVGELTNYPDGGIGDFASREAAVRVGSLFDDPGQEIESLVGLSLREQEAPAHASPAGATAAL